MQITLLTRPEPHRYNVRMIAALRAAGHVVEEVTIEGPDDAERASKVSGPLIDAIALEHFSPAQLASCGARGLVHHPQAASRLLLPLLTRVIATSAAVADHLAGEYNVRRTGITVVTQGVDDAPRSVGSGGPGCAILAIGALSPRRGHDLLLQALARLFDLDWSLTIVGTPHRDPAHAQELAELAAASGIGGRVRFAGALDDSALDAIWQHTDLLAGHPAALADALRRGVPVAVTGESAETLGVPMHAGVVCPPGDRDQLSRALRRLIFDPVLRRAYADAAFAAGGRWPSWSAQAALLADALR